MKLRKAPGYQHPGKAGRFPTPVNPKPDSVHSLAEQVSPRAEIAAPLSRPSPQPENASVRLHIMFREPPTGDVRLYDAMRRSGMDAPTALLRTGRKALRNWIFDDKRVLPSEADFQVDKTSMNVTTTAMLPRSLFDAAKAAFDPFDVLSNRSLGAAIGQTAMKAFVADSSKT